MINSNDPEFQRDLASFRESWIGELFPRLRGRLWHNTSLQALREIRSTGAIEPNRGQFPFTFPQTGNSYGFAKGYVSLFDFVTPTEEECIHFYMKWAGFFSHHKPYTVAIDIAAHRLPGRLVSNEAARLEVGFKKVWIPWVEAWHDGPIPISAFNGYLLIPASRSEQVAWLADGEPGVDSFLRDHEIRDPSQCARAV